MAAGQHGKEQSPGLSRPDRMSTRYGIFRWLVVLLGRVLFGFTVHGAENTPERGRLVVASNHTQYADPVFVCMAVPRRLQWMAKKELFVFPFRNFFKFIGSYPVDREGGGRAALKKSLEMLAAGWAIGIFPEGTHREDKKTSGPKSGAVMLAVRGEAEVLPVYIGKAPTPLGRLRGQKLHAYIGKPVALDKSLRGGRAYRETAERLVDTIYALPEDR